MSVGPSISKRSTHDEDQLEGAPSYRCILRMDLSEHINNLGVGHDALRQLAEP